MKIEIEVLNGFALHLKWEKESGGYETFIRFFKSKKDIFNYFIKEFNGHFNPWNEALQEEFFNEICVDIESIICYDKCVYSKGIFAIKVNNSIDKNEFYQELKLSDEYREINDKYNAEVNLQNLKKKEERKELYEELKKEFES